jgi:hypothetical protein
MRLSDDELREVLERAEEIERTSRRGSEWSAEVAAIVHAGEQVGISRSAVERALTERYDLTVAGPSVGGLAWVRSADDKYYVAEVLEVGERDVRVRFLRGTEHVVTLDQLRPCALIPGERVVVDWPWWGTWTCSVVAYDHKKQRVKLNDGWGYTRTFPVSEIWLAPPKQLNTSRRRVYVAVATASAAAGGVIGALLALLLR